MMLDTDETGVHYVSAGRVDDLADGVMTELSVDGLRLLLARIDGKYYIADAECPHMGGRLALGSLEGTIITCPRHKSQFDIEDGSVVRWLTGKGLVSRLFTWLKPPRPLRTYSVRMKGYEIFVAVPD